MRVKENEKSYIPYYFFQRETIGSKAIVHNYGHCGYGIMASPATSIQVI